ncbi:MAG TPA: hypothetical protein DCE42_24800 [Myxococcales bacterium]|nr:hypothetical protein [Myxococcales bacterium]
MSPTRRSGLSWFHQTLSKRRERQEQQVFRRLYEDVAPRLFRRLLTQGHSQATAEEALHEACIVYWERFHAPIVRGETPPQSPEEPYSWILRVARNKAIDAHRKTSTAQENQEHVKELMHSHAKRHGSLAERQLLQEALEQLSPRDAELLLLRELEGLSYDELAESMSLERGSIGTLLRRARRAFQDIYQSLQQESPEHSHKPLHTSQGDGK